jgi:hypothetical protein
LGGSVFKSVLIIKSSGIGGDSENETSGNPKNKIRWPATDSITAARIIFKELVFGGWK